MTQHPCEFPLRLNTSATRVLMMDWLKQERAKLMAECAPNRRNWESRLLYLRLHNIFEQAENELRRNR